MKRVFFTSSLLAVALVAPSAPERSDDPAPSRVASRPLPARVLQSIAAAEYEASRSGGGLQAPNRAHGFRAWFGSQGIRVDERSADARPLLDLKLIGVGRAGSTIREPPHGEVVAEGARVEIRRRGLVEWYVNTPAGLEQGFTLAERHAGEGKLVLELAVGGAQAQLEGDAVVLASASGRRLRYGGLVARDAAGVVQKARLQVPSARRVRLVVDDADAAYPLVIDPVLSSDYSGATIIESDQSEAALGWSVAGAGDVNGDGYDDVIVSALLYDAGDNDEGAAFLFLGSPSGVATPEPARLESNQAGAHLGASVAGAVDVNADGYDDVIVGAPEYDAGEDDEGAAFVFLGSATGIPSGGPAAAAAQLESNQGFGRLGTSVAGAGDVNGDGYDDVIAGAPSYPTGDLQGAAFVFHGQPGGVASVPAAQISSDRAGYPAFAASVVGAGDLNGDGYGDVLVGAPNYDDAPEEVGGGAVFAFLGGPGGIPGGTPASAATRLVGTAEFSPDFSVFGTSVAGAGDVNGDGYDDVIVGVHAGCGIGCLNGAALVYLGSAAGIPDGDETTAATRLVSPESLFGGSVAGAGDVNGDGYDDLLVGAAGCDGPMDKPDAVFLYLGSAAGIADGGPATAATQVPMDSPGCFPSLSVDGAGDVNGDGRGDVIVGDVEYGGGAPPGAAFVFLGNTCANGADDDGDALVDHPDDPGCAGEADLWERGDAACDDGRDGDGDGLGDYPADPGCEGPMDDSERGAPICDDEVDQDGDGASAFPGDPGCDGPSDPSELGSSRCDNGLDDDGDGLVDAALDPGCQGPADDDERTGAICDDGIDNDGDGDVDYPADSGCDWVSDPAEEPWVCFNGLDDDGDGLVDYSEPSFPFPWSFGDPGCEGPGDASERGVPGLRTPACDDGVDQNGNGLADHPEDPSCESAFDLFEEGGPWLVFTGGIHTIDAAQAAPELVGVQSGWQCTLYNCSIVPTTLRVVATGEVASDVLVIGSSSIEVAGGAVGGDLLATTSFVPCSPFNGDCDLGSPRVTVSSGSVAGGIDALGAEIELRGGTVAGPVRADDDGRPPLLPLFPGSTSSRLLLLGGVVGGVELRGHGEALLAGGSVAGGFETHGDSAALVRGGSLAGALVLYDRSVVEIDGTFDGLEPGDVAATSGILRGRLADGTRWEVPFLREPSATLRLAGIAATGILDDFESGPFELSTFEWAATTERWHPSVLGGVRWLQVGRLAGDGAFLRGGTGALGLWAWDRGGYGRAEGWIGYDGLPDGSFGGQAGRLFADLTGAGRFDRLLIGIEEAELYSQLQVVVYDADSSASMRALITVPEPWDEFDDSVVVVAPGEESVTFPFQGFPGIDFTDVRALSVWLYTGTGTTVALSEIALGPCDTVDGVPQCVPEPSAPLAALAAGLALAALRRRRQP